MKEIQRRHATREADGGALEFAVQAPSRAALDALDPPFSRTRPRCHASLHSRWSEHLPSRRKKEQTEACERAGRRGVSFSHRQWNSSSLRKSSGQLRLPLPSLPSLICRSTDGRRERQAKKDTRSA